MAKTYSEISWTPEETEFFQQFTDPWSIQVFLDSISYNPGYECRSPKFVIKKLSAHCFEGALFAAAALNFIGYKPLIVDMSAENDDDHVIAVFRQDGYWGAVAKSNFTSLRYREPVYRSLRELIMSYFDFYFNINGEKSLRSYSIPFNLTSLNRRNWATTNEDLDYIGNKIESLPHFSVVPEKMIEKLNKASDYMLKAGLLGANETGLYKPSFK
jgi:hypothetical protein